MLLRKWAVVMLSMLMAVSAVLAGCSTETGQESAPSKQSDSKENQQGESATGEPKKGGVLRVAITGEPPTLDAHQTTAFLAQEIGWHIYEGLFTLDENFNPTPLLAKDYTYDEARKTYVIHLREGIKFHNGKVLTTDDVIASLQRWGKKSNYGRILFTNVKEIKKVDDLTLEMALHEPSPNVPILLAYPNQQTAIYPKEIVEAAGDEPIKEFIGTGPFKFVEHKADQYIRLARFEDYKPLDGPANGMGGSRIAYVDEIEFIPTPEVSVRLDGVQTGEFHFAEQVSTDLYEQMKMSNQVESVVVKPYWWPMAVFNKKKGPFADKRMRQAFALALNMEPIMKAAFTSEEFYRLDPSVLFKEQAQWWSDAGKELYNQGDIEKAKQLMKEAGYQGEKIRWITTKEYDFMYKISMVATEQLKEAGFNIELQVVDWATLVERRSNPDEYELFITATTFTPDPGIWPTFDSAWPGFWEDPEKDALLKKVNTEMDAQKRKVLWDEMQAYLWDEMPVVKFGDFFILGAKSQTMKGLKGTPFPFYWNAWIED